METISLGVSSLTCSRLAYGCWRVAGTWNPAEVTDASRVTGRSAIIAAYEAGYTLFDNADIYCGGQAERILGQVLKEVSGMREQVLILTKGGIRPGGDPTPDAPPRYDFSGDYLVGACEQSLKRLGIETIDIYLLHRPDYLANPEEIASAFSKLRSAGKVRYFGVSNFRPTLVTALQAACPMPLIVHQVEISLGRLDCFEDGTLEQCLAEKITPLAWSPLAAGRLSDTLPIDINSPEHARRIGLRETLDDIGRDYGVTRTIVALAWLLKHPAKIIPIVGTTKPERIREGAQAEKLHLSREEWYRLMEAARGERLP